MPERIRRPVWKECSSTSSFAPIQSQRAHLRDVGLNPPTEIMRRILPAACCAGLTARSLSPPLKLCRECLQGLGGFAEKMREINEIKLGTWALISPE